MSTKKKPVAILLYLIFSKLQALQLYPHKEDAEYQLTSMITDIRSICPTEDLVNAMSRSFESPIYRYVVTSTPSKPINQNGYIKKYAYKGWDLLNFFYTTPFYLDTYTRQDEKFSDNLRKAVFEFVHDGKISRWNDWQIYPESTALLHSQMQFVTKYHERECRFWGRQGFVPEFTWIN